jgi:hypothetical protein
LAFFVKHSAIPPGFSCYQSGKESWGMNKSTTIEVTGSKRGKADTRLEQCDILLSDNSTAGSDAMQNIYKCMYSLLTGTLKPEKLGA